MRSGFTGVLEVAERLRSVYGALVRVRLPRIFGVVLRHPRDSVFAVALTLAVIAVAANGLYLQPGRHPAPLFAKRPPARPTAPALAAADLPGRRPADAPAPRSDPVPLPRPRPESDVMNPLWQLTAVQRTLNQAGYGPVRVSGTLDDPTREGIARFERDHKLPITGLNTPRLRHALSAATGKSLE